jgi:hypothetical protein
MDKKNKPNVKRKHEDVEEEDDAMAVFEHIVQGTENGPFQAVNKI